MLSAGGVEVHVAEAGEGSPILFLHGNPDTHVVWNEVASRLVAHHRLIAPDLPGFGKSRAPDDFDVSLEGQSRWVLALLDALGLERVHLAIHDVGGVYGNAFTVEHPERVLTTTIFNHNFFPDYRWHFWGRVWRRRVLGEIAMAVATRPLFVNQMRKGSPGITPELASAAYDAFHRDARRMVLRCYRAANPERLRGWDERLQSLPLPKLVLWGDRDPYVSAATGDRFGGEVHHYPDAGHWLMIDHPDEVAAHMRAHLAAL
jgi:haloalkane dehalogenase